MFIILIIPQNFHLIDASLLQFVVPIAPFDNEAINDAYSRAKKFGYSDFEAWLTSGGDER